MTRYAVRSSQIKFIGYDPATSTLEVEFCSPKAELSEGELVPTVARPASLYEYKGVPASVVAELLFADSIGHAFHQLIKLGGYEYRKLGQEAA